MQRRLLLVGMGVLLASSLLAQNRMGRAGAPPGAAPNRGVTPGANHISFGSGTPFGHGFHRHGFHRTGLLYPWPYFASDYGDYEDSYEPPVPAPQPTPAPQFKPEPIADPVLLEWRGGQWVRVAGFTTNNDSATMHPQSRLPTKEMPPAVLVYRDGHIEELTSYSIIGSSIYTKSDYWTNGAWTRTIQIADLDIPSTLKQNQERGVKFELPSGPNEVMIRP